MFHLEYPVVGLLFALEQHKHLQTVTNAEHFPDLEVEPLDQRHLQHDLHKPLGVISLSQLELLAEPVNDNLNKLLILVLELFGFRFYLVDEDLKLNAGTVL